MNLVILLFLVLIIASLASAMVFMVKDKGGASTRTVRALTFRVGFSLALFVLLMLAHYTGVITLRGSGG
jgi:DMSO/TMAO reductase YedYZ heme-binding membrane subunit